MKYFFYICGKKMKSYGKISILMMRLFQTCLPLLMMLCGCVPSHDCVVLTGNEDFREGDIVLRCGLGMESRAVTESGESKYSHIGLLHYDSVCAQWMVIHAVPGEAKEDELEYLKCEPLVDFYAPDRAKCGAWMRVDCPDSVAVAAVRYAWQKVLSGVTFDNNYLLTDTTQLYCTELVWQAFLHQGLDLTEGRRHDVPLLFSKDGECIFPEDIEESSKILYVQQFKTKPQ